MSHFGHDRFERLIAENYEGLKAEVLATVRGKLAVDSLHPDATDLDAAYNAAWHGLYEQFSRDPNAVRDLGGWLATIAYRRAIDEIRSARLKYRAVTSDGGQNAAADGCYEFDVDDAITDRQKYRQWLLSLRLRLDKREQQAVTLCVLHEYSRKDASELMGIDIRRLDKLMVAASKKLGGLLESIDRGDWCEDQRSLIKAYALGLHDEGGERHALAIAHLTECQACGAYVRSLRGLTIALPAPALLAGAASAGGGIAAALSGLFNGGGAGASGTAAAGGGATLLGAIGAKSAALCLGAVCAAGGAVLMVEHAPDRTPASPPAKVTRLATRAPAAPPTTRAQPTTATTSKPRPSRSAKRTATVDPKSTGAQQIAELGIEPQATSPPPAPQARAASVPQPPAASEFGIEGP
jgi:DNA-directed RNA polymerase specialized sigma24 family protein